MPDKEPVQHNPADALQQQAAEVALDATDLPSKLKDPKERHDEIQQRMAILRRYAEDHQIAVPKTLAGEEHFWYRTLEQYYQALSITRKHFPTADKTTQRIASLEHAIASATVIVQKDQERITDGLTGAWSRKALDNFLENLKVRPRAGVHTGVLIIDVDHFKKINDTQGHPAGDQKLKDLVDLMQRKTRGQDMVARYGGEEFCVVITSIQNQEAISRKAEELRSAVEQGKMGFTVSIGTTTLKPEDETIEETYKRADRHLYEAKENGRNAAFDDKGKIAYVAQETRV